MKLTVFITFIIFIFNLSLCQVGIEGEPKNLKTTKENSISKSDLVGTWRACGDPNWDENSDTLRFQRPTPNCRNNNCGEHNWSFRESGSVEFIYTDGCDTGFHSVSKNPKRWLFIEKDKRIKMITNDGYVEYFDVLKLDKKLVLIHRRDLELE